MILKDWMNKTKYFRIRLSYEVSWERDLRQPGDRPEPDIGDTLGDLSWERPKKDLKDT